MNSLWAVNRTKATYDTLRGREEKTMSNDTIVTNNDVVNEAHNETHHDARVGGELGGVGGAVTGAIAGSAAGPVGTIGGAIVGGVLGAVASSAAVNAVDKIDDDTTITGLGHHTAHTVDNAAVTAGNTVAHPEGYVPGVQTGGRAIDGSGAPDTRGVTEKVADTLTGDHIDDKTGRPV
jgi:outer membrane lipoprotein SlyB